MLKNELKQTKYIAICADSWTSSHSSHGDAFIGITCQFINNEWEMKRFLLETVLVTEAENSNYIATTLKEVFMEWEILDKVVSITTDSAAVMIKAVELLQIRHIPCCAHALNNVIISACNHKDHPAITALITKCKNIASFFHRSSKANRILEGYKSELPQKEKPGKLKQMIKDDLIVFFSKIFIHIFSN